MGGREGLVDTAVKTAETGYGKTPDESLEDLSLQYDTTVRNEATVVHRYGDDGLNPQEMENGGRPVDFDRLYTNTSMNTSLFDKRLGSGRARSDEGSEDEEDEEEPLGADEVQELFTSTLENADWQALINARKEDGSIAERGENKFITETKSYFGGMSIAYVNLSTGALEIT